MKNCSLHPALVRPYDVLFNDTATTEIYTLSLHDALPISPSLRRNFVEFAVGRAENPRGRPTFEQQVADGRIFFGTPKTVIPKLRRVLEETRPSIYGIWGNDGSVSNEDARTC